MREIREKDNEATMLFSTSTDEHNESTIEFFKYLYIYIYLNYNIFVINVLTISMNLIECNYIR